MVYVELPSGWKVLLLKQEGGKLLGFTKVSKGKGAFGLVETLRVILDKKTLITETQIRPAVQAKLVAAAVLPADPYIFKVNTPSGKYIMAVEGRSQREKWLKALKAVVESGIAEREMERDAFEEAHDMTENPMSPGGGGAKQDGSAPRANMVQLAVEEREKRLAEPRRASRRTIDSTAVQKYIAEKHMKYGNEYETIPGEEGEPPRGGNQRCRPCKVDNMVRVFKIILGFPFVIVIATMTLSERFAFLRSVSMIRIMNLSIYLLAPFFVDYILSDTTIFWQRVAIGSYCALYLIPVISVIMQKLTVQTAKDVVDGSTFCFKPARRMRWTMANMFLLSGFLVDWIQHSLYVLPLGIVTEEKATTLEELPPYLPFTFYFYTAFLSILICALTLILNAALRGKAQYAFNRSFLLWLFYFNIGGSYFVSVVTIMFMGLWCDYETYDEPRLVQSYDIKCWEGNIIGLGFNHRKMAYCAMLGLAFFLIQMSLLPAGTFKETMTDTALDIVFVPVYLQMHMLLKAIFSGIYVLFYTAQYSRVISLTFINLLQLVLNQSMAPCSIPLVNVWRDITYLTSLLSGVQSLNYIIFDHTNSEVKELYLSSFMTNMFICTIGVLVYHYNTRRSQEYIIARAFLDLEWQVTRGYNVVNPRVLEPLIALTLSDEESDRKVAVDHVDQMVWLISYPNIRVQFQSIWGLANVCIFDEAVRIKVHEAGGTATLFELYSEMDFMVQLEALATLANLSLSHHVTRYMVKHHNAIAFFLELARSNRTRHSDFATVALGNICRYPDFCNRLIDQGGLPVLVGCFISSDYGKKRSACRALANVCLTPKMAIEKAFSSRQLLQRVVKFSTRNEVETQLEVAALLRALMCRPKIRTILLSLKVHNAVDYFAHSSIPDVKLMSDDMYTLMEFELGLAQRDNKSFDENYLDDQQPLDGMINWNSWGSKLDSIFAPVFNAVPLLSGLRVTAKAGVPIEIDMSHGISETMKDAYKDGMTFYISERASNGELVERENSAIVSYTSERNFHGSDYFVFTVQMGGLQSPPSTVTILVTEDHDGDIEMGSNSKDEGGRRNRSTRNPMGHMHGHDSDDDDDDEDGSTGGVGSHRRTSDLKGLAKASVRRSQELHNPAGRTATASALSGNMRQSRRQKKKKLDHL